MNLVLMMMTFGALSADTGMTSSGGGCVGNNLAQICDVTTILAVSRSKQATDPPQIGSQCGLNMAQSSNEKKMIVGSQRKFASNFCIAFGKHTRNIKILRRC